MKTFAQYTVVQSGGGGGHKRNNRGSVDVGMHHRSLTTKGALPPSSMDVLLTVDAACFSSSLPTAVDPVKEIFLTASSVERTLPTS